MFDWDSGNIDHIARHAITPEEAEEVVQDPRRVDRDAYDFEGKHREAIIGLTGQRRLLVVFYTIREGRVRVVTARPARPSELRRYRAGTP